MITELKKQLAGWLILHAPAYLPYVRSQTHNNYRANECRERRRSLSRDKMRKEGRCFKCNKRGHKQRDCSRGRRSNSRSSSRSSRSSSRGDRRKHRRDHGRSPRKHRRSVSDSRSPSGRSPDKRRSKRSRSRSYSASKSRSVSRRSDSARSKSKSVSKPQRQRSDSRNKGSPHDVPNGGIHKDESTAVNKVENAELNKDN